MRYQVIFQFPETFFLTLDDLIAFEKKLMSSLSKTCDVDGYDTRSGTTTFFGYTDSPLAALKHFRTHLGTNQFEKNLRVSYRDVDGDAYINIWPSLMENPPGSLPDSDDPPELIVTCSHWQAVMELESHEPRPSWRELFYGPDHPRWLKWTGSG